MQLADPLDSSTYTEENSIYHSLIKTKAPTPAYEAGWERIFGKRLNINFYFGKRPKYYGKQKRNTYKKVSKRTLHKKS